ncbi:MAG: hypothetical protein JWQ35_2433 [Bacteriovoracaceae bacterium]|nr:hypothetical protein [Bacteriovoracaceae bacterium]
MLTLVSCRSGHFEQKSFQQSIGYQIVSVSSKTVGNCADSANCKRLELVFNAVGQTNSILRGHVFQISIQHPEMSSTSPLTIVSSPEGELRFQIDVKTPPNGGPTIYRSLFTVKSSSLGERSYLASFNPNRDQSPLVSFEDAPQNFSPDTQAVQEHLVANPEDLASLNRTDKSSQAVEFQVQHRLTLKNQDDLKLKNRNIFYKIYFTAPWNIPTVEGAEKTNESGELFLKFPVSFRPFEDETNIDVKIEFSFTEDFSEKTEENFILNFDHDALKPLVGYRREQLASATKLATSDRQQIRLQNFVFAENKDAKTFDVDEKLNLVFIPQLKASGTLELSRSRFGRDREWKGLSGSRVKAKIFTIIQNESGGSKTISIQIVKNILTGGEGEVVFHFEPNLQKPSIESEKIKFAFELELPDFPKIQKAFFVWDPELQILSTWTAAEAFQALHEEIYDTDTILNLDSKASEFFSKRYNLKAFSPEIDTLVAKAVASNDPESWKQVFIFISQKTKSNFSDIRLFHVESVDFVQNLKEKQLIEQKQISTILSTPENKQIEISGTRFTFKLQGSAERCFIFTYSSPLKEFYLCSSKTTPFDREEQWLYYPSVPSHSESINVLLKSPAPLSLSEILDQNLLDKPANKIGIFKQKSFL